MTAYCKSSSSPLVTDGKFTADSGYQLSSMNSQFYPVQIKEILDFEEELAEAKN
jgi:hypothetical protein